MRPGSALHLPVSLLLVVECPLIQLYTFQSLLVQLVMEGLLFSFPSIQECFLQSQLVGLPQAHWSIYHYMHQQTMHVCSYSRDTLATHAYGFCVFHIQYMTETHYTTCHAIDVMSWFLYLDNTIYTKWPEQMY